MTHTTVFSSYVKYKSREEVEHLVKCWELQQAMFVTGLDCNTFSFHLFDFLSSETPAVGFPDRSMHMHTFLFTGDQSQDWHEMKLFKMVGGASIAANHVIRSRKVRTKLRCSILCFEEQTCGAFSLDDEMNCVLGSVGCEDDLAEGAGQVFLYDPWSVCCTKKPTPRLFCACDKTFLKTSAWPLVSCCCSWHWSDWNCSQAQQSLVCQHACFLEVYSKHGKNKTRFFYTSSSLCPLRNLLVNHSCSLGEPTLVNQTHPFLLPLRSSQD